MKLIFTGMLFYLQKLQAELDGLRSSVGDVSRRCVKFFEEKPASSGIPVLRSELSHAVEKMDKLHNLSAVYLEKLDFSPSVTSNCCFSSESQD